MTQPRLADRQAVALWYSTLFAGCGMVFLVVLASLSGARSETSTGLALGVVVSFSASALAALLAVARTPAVEPRFAPSDNRWRLATLLGVALLVGLVVQTRFRSGTVLGWGDFPPLAGSAWINDMFHPWQSDGFDLGQLGNSGTSLPLAALAELVKLLGGSMALVQRLFFSGMWALIPVSAALLLQELGLTPGAAGVGGLAYFFTPYLLTTETVMTPVVSVAMVLLPFSAWWIFRAARSKKLPVGLWLLPAIGSVLLGFTYIDPPYAAAALVTMVVAGPLLAWWIYGIAAFRRLIPRLVIALGILLLCSAYWAIPSALQLVEHVVAVRTLSGNSWESAEGRATLANALWLNELPLWRETFYYPDSAAYYSWPLSFLRFAMGGVAFSSLFLCRRLTLSRENQDKQLGRVIPLLVLACLLVQFLSTGTNSPGSVLFDALYHLPYGWLLQQPYRFLYISALCYALLVAVVARQAAPSVLLAARSVVQTTRSVAQTSRAAIRKAPTPRGHSPLSRHVVLVVGALSALGAVVFYPAFPEITGGVIPTHPGSAYPSARVRFPTYWTNMADQINKLRRSGALVVLPPHEKYNVTRGWYYGNTSFIQTSIARPVLDGSANGGYLAFSQTFSQVPAIVASYLVDHRWQEANRLFQVVGASYVLVSADVEAGLPGDALRQAFPADTLKRALTVDPLVHKVLSDGPLTLFGTVTPSASSVFDYRQVLFDSNSSPSLAALAALPPGSAIVSRANSQAGGVFKELNPSQLLRLVPHGGTVTIPLDRSLTYQVEAIPSNSTAASPRLQVLRPGASVAPDSGLRIRLRQKDAQEVIQAKVAATALLREASLESPAWRFGNCATSDGQAGLVHVVNPTGGPNGTPALILGSTAGSACVTQASTWKASSGNSVVLSLWVRHVSGAPPRLCVWQSNISQCAGTSPIPVGQGWRYYQTIVPVTAASGRLSLFFYGDSPAVAAGRQGPGSVAQKQTVDEYADVHLESLPVDDIVIVGQPKGTSHPLRPVLANSYTTFGSGWTCPAGSNHVAVDGLTNGCLADETTRATPPQTPRFSLGSIVRFGYGLSAVTAAILALFVILSPFVRRKARRPLIPLLPRSPEATSPSAPPRSGPVKTPTSAGS